MQAPIPVLKSVAGLRHFLQTQRANVQSHRQSDRPLGQSDLVPKMGALHQENVIASGGMGFRSLHDGRKLGDRPTAQIIAVAKPTGNYNHV
jgi:hypothetical protein